MINVPPEFRPRHPIRYPSDNVEYSEEFYMNAWRPKDKRSRAYLPIQWTAYNCRNLDKKKLQSYVDSIKQPAYTIVQFDDGPCVDVPKNIKIFAMSSPGYPLPLLCSQHRWEFSEARSVFASFSGAETHPIRRQMFEATRWSMKYRVELQSRPLMEYCRMMARSVFALCPRGYGVSSFRIAEAISYGAIPVYISDEFIQPYGIDFNEYGVLVNDVSQIRSILEGFTPEQIRAKQQLLMEVEHLFTYQGMKEMVLKNLEDETI